MDAVKKIKLFYFSGTGNAKRIALWFSAFAAKRNIRCQLYNISKTEIDSMDAAEPDVLCMIISPVHGFNFPKITLHFIEHFPKGKNNIILMNTRAGMRIGRWVTPGLTGVAFLLSSFLLKRKGYKIKGQIPFDMPSNWISIHPVLGKKTVAFLHAKNYSRAEKYAAKIFSGKPVFPAYRDLVQDILISPVSLAYYLVGRFAFAKSFYASPKCDHCDICIKTCPVNAITHVNGRPFWTFKCESCMKCMNFCPQQAIETAHGLFIAIIILNGFITFLLYKNLLHFIQPGFARFLVSNLVFFILLWVSYQLQHQLLRIKFFGKLISLFSLTHYKFWGRYKSIPDNKWKQ